VSAGLLLLDIPDVGTAMPAVSASTCPLLLLGVVVVVVLVLFCSVLK